MEKLFSGLTSVIGLALPGLSSAPSRQALIKCHGSLAACKLTGDSWSLKAIKVAPRFVESNKHNLSVYPRNSLNLDTTANTLTGT